MNDPAAMTALRTIIRNAWLAGKRLPQGDPAVRDTLNQLDEACCDLTVEIEASQPELPLRRVVGVGIDRVMS